jgi:hypothetical protein
MTIGKMAVNRIFATSPIEIVQIEAGKPRTARRKLKQILSPLSGIARLCNTYYGIRSLDALALVPASCNLRFITSVTSEKSLSLAGPISDFKREHSKVEMRVLPPPITIHDRYLLTSDSLLILGQGIKDIGAKDSFIIIVFSSFAMDLLRQTESTFEKNWSRATSLSCKCQGA